MGTDSSIEWLGEGGITSSPWEGCTKVHAGCAHCYAEGRNSRFSGGANWGKGAPRRVAKGFWTEVPRHARKLAAQGKRGSLFMSICDPLDPEVWDEPRAPNGCADRSTAHDMLRVLRATMGVIRWLLLTKRPGMWKWIPEDVRAHTWLLYSASDQKTLEAGVGDLLAAEGFAGLGLSLEPLLGPVDLRRYMWPVHARWPAGFDTPEAARAAGAEVTMHRQALVSAHARFLDWVIVGGESGHGARPYDLAWPRSIIAQCRDAGVSVFHKQLGARPVDSAGVVQCAGLALDQGPLVRPLRIADKKGGDCSWWPADLRVREWPEGLRR